MIFKRDVFISYAHIDNVALKEGEHGWVENFHRALEVRLAQLRGEKADIWRDQKLKGNDIFSEEIVEQFPKTAVLISILSPRYIKSEWCTRELREFLEAAASRIGTKVGNKSRIFKLIKTAVPYNAHPPEIADTLGYDFFITDPYTGRVKELNQKCSGELEQIYWDRFEDLARDICDLLKKLRQEDEIIPTEVQPKKIYLAETCADLKKHRDMIKRELIVFGFDILPDCRLPFVESEYKKSVENFLDQSVLSIHLVGGNYGVVPEGSKKSVTVLQNELAVKKSKAGKLQRLIWLPPDSNIDMEDERQKQFIHQVRTDAETLYGADMFETSIVNFKYALREKLKDIEEKKPKKKEEENVSIVEPGIEEPQRIYLICDHRDLDDIIELEDFLYQNEFDVILPAFEGEEEDLMQNHRENLKFCDAAVIYYGSGNDFWMQTTARDLIKIAGYGRTHPLHVKAVLLAPPVSRLKERFRLHDAIIINGMEGFSPGLMEPFIEIVRAIGK